MCKEKRTRWEYKFVVLLNFVDDYSRDTLDNLGSQGWEYCDREDHAGRSFVLFKRKQREGIRSFYVDEEGNRQLVG